MLKPTEPALILAPMEGLTDAPMRAVQAETGAFSFAVSEFFRIVTDIPGKRAFKHHVPELSLDRDKSGGLPVQVQLLGGNASAMAQSAVVACEAGAKAIDINFGCPAPIVNRNDGGAVLLKYPDRIREIVKAMREAVPNEIPVSAKLRLGWDDINAIDVNAEMAAEGGADWLTIHARTKVQGYKPPVFWDKIGVIRERLGIPIVANGDIWTIDDFRRCREESGCIHYMIGRGALANPILPNQIAHALGINNQDICPQNDNIDWAARLQRLVYYYSEYDGKVTGRALGRCKHWLRLAYHHGNYTDFDAIKQIMTLDELFGYLQR